MVRLRVQGYLDRWREDPPSVVANSGKMESTRQGLRTD